LSLLILVNNQTEIMNSLKHPWVFIVFFCAHFLANGQQSNFYHDFENDKPWTQSDWIGDTSKFSITDGYLFTNNATINDTFLIIKPVQRREETEWSVDVNLPFATSSTNYVDVLLIIDSTHLKNALNGYFIRIGGTKDQLMFYQLVDGNQVEIVASAKSITHSLSGVLRVLVDSNQTAHVSFYDSSKRQYIWEDSVSNFVAPEFGYLGLKVRQSTTSFHHKHRFDNIYYGPITEDSLPPVLKTIQVVDSTTLQLIFDEEIDSSVVGNEHFLLKPGFEIPSQIEYSQDTIWLNFASEFESKSYSLYVKFVSDLNSNSSEDFEKTFTYVDLKPGNLHDVVLSEILADYSPNVGLPLCEYIELTNRSRDIFDLEGWMLTDQGSICTLASYVLWPDSVVLVCDEKDVHLFKSTQNVIAVKGLVSFNNSGDTITLLNADNELVFQLPYTVDWHSMEWKKEGGWSLEMIDIDKPCAGATNWASSVAVLGGTPGTRNSVANSIADVSPPAIVDVKTTKYTVVLTFDESIEYYTPVLRHFYIIDNVIIGVSKPNSHAIQLEFGAPLVQGKAYELSISGVTDCSGNTFEEEETLVAIGSSLHFQSLVINEVLYDVSDLCVEFVELYNPTDSIYNLVDLYTGTKDSVFGWQKLYLVTTSNYLVHPKQYVALVSDTTKLKKCKPNTRNVIMVDRMPKLTNGNGNIGISDKWGMTIDSFNYSEEMHFTLLQDTKDVSLELVNPNSSEAVWTSAAQSYNYATPGFKNSHTSSNEAFASPLNIVFDPITPNNDGNADYLILRYNSTEEEVINVRIFNHLGRLVSFPVNASLTGAENEYIWDCIGESGKLVPDGIYILHVDSITTSGKVNKYKTVFTVSR
jgi:hypothetical protein